MQKKRNTKSALNPIELCVALVCVAGITVALVLFKKDMSVSLSKTDEKPIAVIYYKYNTAQRRFKNRNLWEQVKQSSPVYDGDLIRTAAQSEAYTVFNDGSKIELHENSLIQVFSKKNANSLEFIKGSVSVSAPAQKDTFSVRTGNTTLKMAQNTNAVISLPKSDDGKTMIAVTSGSVKIKNEIPEPPAKTPAALVKKITEQVTKSVTQTVTGKPVADDTNVVETVSAGKMYAYVPEALPEPDAQNKTASKTSVGAVKKTAVQSDVHEYPVVFMPASSCTITAKSGQIPMVSFYWLTEKTARLEFSYTPQFSKIIAAKKLEPGNRRASVPLDFAQAGETIFWRTLNEGDASNTASASGLIVLRDAQEEKDSFAMAAKETFGVEKAAEVQSAVATSEAVVEKAVAELPAAPVQVISPSAIEETSAVATKPVLLGSLATIAEDGRGVNTVTANTAPVNTSATQNSPVKKTEAEQSLDKPTDVKKTTSAQKTAPVKKTTAPKKAPPVKKTSTKKATPVKETAPVVERKVSEQPPVKEVAAVKTVAPETVAPEPVVKQPADSIVEPVVKDAPVAEPVSVSSPSASLSGTSNPVNEAHAPANGESTPAAPDRPSSTAPVKQKPSVAVEQPVVLSTPVLTMPAPNTLFTENDFDTVAPKIEFTWNKVNDATWYRFTLYQGADMKTKLAAYKVNGTSFALSGAKLSLMDNGDLVWTVEAVCEKNGKRYIGKPAASTFKLDISQIGTVDIDTSNLLEAR